MDKYNIHDIYSNYSNSFSNLKKYSNDVTVEIVGGEADIDPLTLLRIYDETPTVDNELALATGFCTNRVVRFFKNDKQIYEVNFQGGDISDSFKGYPFLLDLLLKLSYGLMLKKLTPPSEDLVSEERQ